MIRQYHSKVTNATRPLKVMFMVTSMPIGGAETLLVNLVRSMDRRRCDPEIICLKEPGPLGEEIAAEIPVHSRLISHKYDVAVVSRLRRLLADRRSDALVTVGAGDKMFWGRLAARYARLPVILSALHSTGWPDGVGRLNRMLTGITDGFIAVASSHARYLVAQERFPENKVFLIPNGIDTRRFVFHPADRARIRAELKIAPTAPVVGIVAALRPEKNHALFLKAAREVLVQRPDAKFLIVGDGPQRPALESLGAALGVEASVVFVGSRADIPAVLSALDLFVLTSHNEASPVSILEAMACGRPIVAPDVGSIGQSLIHDRAGFLVRGHDVAPHAQAWLEILSDPQRRESMGLVGREQVVRHGSLAVMTRGYEDLLWQVYRSKQRLIRRAQGKPSPECSPCSGRTP